MLDKYEALMWYMGAVRVATTTLNLVLLVAIIALILRMLEVV